VRQRSLEDDAEPTQGTNFAGAVYGSLLAGSVVAGTSPLEGAPTLGELVALLLVSGLVFWLAHVYARVIGDRVTSGAALTWALVRSVARHEWPLVEAAIGPCIVAALVTLFGGTALAATWSALIAAIVGQVGWAVLAARRTGLSTALVIVSAAVNLLLGLILIGLKTSLTH
jgi:hypothetical protein